MRFCGMCGTRLARLCDSCGFANPHDYRFCGSCGQPLVGGVAQEHLPVAARRAQAKRPPIPVSSPGAPLSLLQSTLSQAGAEPLSAQPRGPKQVRLEGERRIATVILADVQGSTHLMERIGTEAWVAMMNRIFHILESEIYRYGGTVDQFRGDGLVAFFGTMVAHEDDPERAVLASLSMQKAIARYGAELADQQGIDLGLRVGVNTGEVIVANIGDRTQHSEDTAMGEAIALAARMEQAAEPGTVLVSENTYDLVESRFHWESLGEITVKGISHPVSVYRPIASSAKGKRGSRLETYGLSSQLIGRDSEFEEIKQRVDDLRRGRGGIVLLTGDEGMGKSHLVSQVRQQVLRDDALLAEAHAEGQQVHSVTWLRGRCRSYEQFWPYSMWLDLLRLWLGVHSGSREELRDRLHTQADELWQDRAGEYAPFLSTLLSLPLEDEVVGQVESLDAEALHQQLFVAVRAWVEAMAQRGLVVFVFDDVYWADATSLELLEYCLPLCDRQPVLFLIMFRPHRTSGVWQFHQRIETEYSHRLLALVLDPFTDLQASKMVDGLIGAAALPPETRAQIIEKAEGNPYYIVEIIGSLIRDDTLVRDTETQAWRLTRAVDAVDLPDTLRGLLAARMDDLSPEERHVLQLAAIVGPVFWENVLRELVGPSYALDQHLVALQQAQLIQEQGRVPDLGMEYMFRSALICDLACDSVLSAQRAAYARQVADYLAGLFGGEALAEYYDVVAYQYRCAGEQGRELFYILSAAEHAQGIYANTEAIEYYTRALELLDALEEEDQDGRSQMWQDWRIESLKGLGTIYFGIGRVDEAETYLRRAISLAEGDDARLSELVRLYYWLCEVLFWQGRYEEQIRVAESGLRLLGDDTQSVEAALMNQEIAVGYRARGERAKFLEFTGRTARFLESLPYSEELRPAYDHIVTMYAFARKDVEEALRWLRVLRERATAHHDVRAIGQADDYAGIILGHTGDLGEALSRHAQALERFQSIGDARHAVDALCHLSQVCISWGDLDQALEYIDQALGMEGRPRGKGSSGWLYWRRGCVLFAREAWDAAKRDLKRSIQLFGEAGEPRWAGMATYYLGRVYLVQKERASAARLFAEATTLAGPEVLAQEPLALAAVLDALERTSEDSEAFRTFCQGFQVQGMDTPFVQWALEPAEVATTLATLAWDDRFADTLADGWVWQDPRGDCAFGVEQGLQIYAANGRDLCLLNLGAPRVTRPTVGDWVVETVCAPVSNAQPAIGGLLAYVNEQDYLRLDRGVVSDRSIVLMGCLNNQDVVIGRGLLPFEADRVHLRLECIGGRARALCSADGVSWFSVGETAFPAKAPVQVGMYAAGSIDRVAYPGAHREGAAVQFESFRSWTMAANPPQ